MRKYFITVRDKDVAKKVDPDAVYIETLPRTDLVYSYCCRSAHVVGEVPEAYIFLVSVEKRKDAEKASGVVRCRAKEPERYKTQLTRVIC